MKHDKCGRAVNSECNEGVDGSAYTTHLNTPPVGDAYSKPYRKGITQKRRKGGNMMMICMLIPLSCDDIYDEIKRYECIGGSLDDILAFSLTTSLRRKDGDKCTGSLYHFWYVVPQSKCRWGRAPPLSRSGLIIIYRVDTCGGSDQDWICYHVDTQLMLLMRHVDKLLSMFS